MGTAAQTAEVTPPPRSRYRKLFDLATGGMGRVELALAVGEGNFARMVALKRLHPQYEEDEGFRASFFDEARLAGLIHHANVASVIDVGKDENGYYLAMEYVEGQTLAALIVRVRERSDAVPVQLACRIMALAARGLAAAHDLCSLAGEPLQLVHRDVSPQNIIVGYDGSVKVVDFGVARAAGRLQSTLGMSLKGKLGYMSPEQLQFQPPDHRSDLFAFGVVLFELLTMHRLYRNDDNNDGPRRILHEAVPSLRALRPGAPPELESLCASLLAKAPEQRPQSAAQVAVQLEAIAASLAAREGPLDIAALMKGRFADELAERRNAIRSALDPDLVGPKTTPDIRVDGASGSVSKSQASAGGVSVVRASGVVPSIVPRLAMVGVVVVAMIAGAFLALHGTGSDTPASTASPATGATHLTTPVVSVVRAAVPPPPSSASPTVAAPTMALPIAPTAPQPVPTSPTTEVAVTPARPQHPSATRNSIAPHPTRPTRATSGHTKRGTPMWGWD